MINNIRKLGHKKLAICLLAIFATELLCPSLALALTSGPTTPETTSFEPVDTTDMVNLQTGDFTYNVPLLEVPGPEGGYPLALSYHAGILPGEDASWVGLGWTLNPGALNRSVNGYPDDWYDQKQTVRDYWEGGTTKSYNVGVSVGIAGAASAGVGLEFSSDTYRGFGLGTSVSMGYGPINATVGTSAYGVGYGNVGLGISYGGASAALVLSGQGISATAGIGAGGANLGGTASTSSGLSAHGGIGIKGMGMSMSTLSSKPSFSVGGISSSINNETAGKIQTTSSNFSMEIPVFYFNIRLGYNKTRYWSDESVSKYTHGSLNGLGWSASDDRAYDTYSLLDSYGDKNFIDEPDPRRTLGGSYPDVDLYSVSAQGLGGNIRPYFFQGHLRSQNLKKDSKYSVEYTSQTNNGNVPEFRFVNDFSNSYRQNYDNNGFDSSPKYGSSANPDFLGYNGGNKLQGSKNIERYLLDEVPIKPRNAKGYSSSWVKNLVINSSSASSSRSRLIGGFSITNESGVTYHFALPAYSYKEEIYQQSVSSTSGFSFNHLAKPEPYAYTWHLTAITGADYVDRNGNSIVDDGDWGYWVSFEYGKFTSNYVWRNPENGFHQDEDSDFQNMSIGTKEVYYLNAIRTRSHIALFEKDFRLDGKSVSSDSYRPVQNDIKKGASLGSFSDRSVHSMKLNKIYLFNASDSAVIDSRRGGVPEIRSYACPDCEMPLNVIDRNDVETTGRALVESKALRIIDLNHDYSLTKNTANSFDINASTVKSGKLTLNNIKVRGKGGASLLPSTSFEYDLPKGQPFRDITFVMNESTFTSNDGSLSPGDMLEDGNGNFYGVVTSYGSPNDPNMLKFYTYKIQKSDYAISLNTRYSVRVTKNPPYSKSNKDFWGYYKSDYKEQAPNQSDKNLGAETTSMSRYGTDAWSLRRIKPSLGNEISIEYESDDFQEVVMEENAFPIIFEPRKINDYKISFELKTSIPDVYQYLQIGQKFNALIVADDIYHYRSGGGIFNNSYDEVHKLLYDVQLTITSISGSRVEATTNVLMKAYDLDNYWSVPTHRDFKILTGNLQLPSNNIFRYGGGIRVKTISITDSKGIRSETSYSYKQPGNSDLSSGVTSYLPGVLPKFQAIEFRRDAHWMSKIHIQEMIKKYQKLLYREHQELYALAREIPPPSVMYKTVSVQNSVFNLDGSKRSSSGKTVYEFDTFRKNRAGRIVLNNQGAGTGVVNRNQVLKRFVSSIGNLKSMKTYAENGQLIKEIRNHYLHDGLDHLTLNEFMTTYESKLENYHYQGLLKERVFESKKVFDSSNSYNTHTLFNIYNGREEYPCIQIGTTEIDYVTNTKVKSTNLGFDFYSGSVVKSLTEDGYGNRFLTEQIPAYTQYPEMGITAYSKKNMLSQSAGHVVYKVDAANNKLGIIGASVQTWSNTSSVLDTIGNPIIQNNSTYGNIWRAQNSYSWMPTKVTNNGMTATNDFAAFNYKIPSSSHTNWQNTGGATLYDVYSNVVEAKDINGNHSTARLGKRSSRVYITGGPAKYTELAFSGAEDETINSTNQLEVQYSGATVTSDAAHSGTKSLLLGTKQRGFQYTVPINKLTKGREYSAAVWVKGGMSSDTRLYYQVNGASVVSSVSSSQVTKKSGDWTLLTLNIKAQDIDGSGNLTVYVQNNTAATVYVDDFRFQPMDASSTAYVYDSFSGELTYVLDNNNLFTKYEYDNLGRLRATYVEKMGGGIFKTSENQYNYGKPIEVQLESFSVYARCELLNYNFYNYTYPPYEEGRTETKADVYIRFYTDQSCTERAVLPSSLPLLYEEHISYYDEYGSSHPFAAYTIVANQGVSEVLVNGQIIVEERDSYWDNYSYRLITQQVTRDFNVIPKFQTGPGNYFPLNTVYYSWL